MQFSGVCSTESQKQKAIKDLTPLCKRLITQYPRCMFAFCYYRQRNDIVYFLDSPPIPEPVKPIECYRGLPKVPFPMGDLHSRTYNVGMDKLKELTLCQDEQLITTLNDKWLSANNLTYSDLMDLLMDHRTVVRYSKKGEATCLRFSDPNSFDSAVRLIDKVVFSDLYEAAKRETNLKCYCCEDAAGQVIHHINGNHYDMIDENLAFLCNGCHYELHREGIERRRVKNDYRNTNDEPVGDVR